MNTQQTNVDIEGMRRALPAFESAWSGINRSSNTMHEQDAQLRSAWQTDADGGATAFFAALDEWLRNCDIVKQQLKIVTEKLQQNTHAYQRAHMAAGEASANAQRSLNAGLPGF
ncbi:hypothetical protein [Streptomyces tubercidicus]|uniref:hypothetical protein n=1 Tax=Streptomyces tubercidicus TaxID=47759 RepID=UPI00369CAE06